MPLECHPSLASRRQSTPDKRLDDFRALMATNAVSRCKYELYQVIERRLYILLPESHVNQSHSHIPKMLQTPLPYWIPKLSTGLPLVGLIICWRTKSKGSSYSRE